MTANMETITIKRRSKCLSLQSTKKIGCPAHMVYLSILFSDYWKCYGVALSDVDDLHQEPITPAYM